MSAQLLVLSVFGGLLARAVRGGSAVIDPQRLGALRQLDDSAAAGRRRRRLLGRDR